MASLSKDQVVGIIKAAPAGVRPEDVVTELVKAGHVLEGYGTPATPEPQRTGPGMQPPGDEKAVWDAGKAAGGDYYATKAKALDERNKATQGQPPGSLAQVAKGAAQMSSDMAFAAPKLAKAGVQGGAKALREAAPTSKVAAGAAAATDFASNVIPTTPGEAAAQAVGERYAGPAIKAVGKAANPVAKKALGFMAEKFGGISGEVTKVLEKRAPDVMRYARQGVEGAEEAASSAAKAVKKSIDEYVDRAGVEYRAALDNIIARNPTYNAIRVDLGRMAGKAVEAIRQDFGFPEGFKRAGMHSGPTPGYLPNLQLTDQYSRPIQAAQGAIQRVGKAASDTELFNEFAGQFRDGLTPTQAYLLQKDLSYAIRANADKPIAAALGQLKKAAIDAFDNSIGGTPLQGINKGYRMAMTLAEDLSKVSNADNAVSVINTAFRNRSETRDALNAIAKISPDVSQELENMFAATAGKQVAHWTAQLPPTGAKALYQVGLGANLVAVGANPVLGIPSSAAYLAATSPRVYGEAFNALTKSLPNLPRGSTTAALAALRARRKEER